MIHVLYEDNHVLVVEKPVNIPVQEDSSHDLDLLTMCKQYIKETYNKPGNVYLGLVHRLDRPVGGVMIFAKTSKAASRLSDQVRTHTFKKEYLALLDGTPKKKQGTLVDYLKKDTKNNRVTVTNEKEGKKSILHYDVLETKQNRTLVHITLETGRSHQIRVQFSSRNLPLVYDQRYNPHTKKGQIALYAYQLTFIHPTQKEPMTISCLPPKKDPWNLFEVEQCLKNTKEKDTSEKVCL